MERSIGELLSGEPAEAPVVEAQEPVNELASEAEAQADDRPRDEHGRFLPKEATGVEEPQATAEQVPPTEQPSGLPQEVYEPLKAVRNENRELKQQIEALNQRFATLQQPPPVQEVGAEFWDNPQGAIAAQVQQMLTVRELSKSIGRAKTRYPDFDGVFEEFNRLEGLNPALTQQALASDDPAEFAYQTAKKAAEVAKYGSIDALLTAKRAEWEQEARAAMPQPTVTLPSTTATDGSVGGRSGPVWAGPPTIGEMLR